MSLVPLQSPTKPSALSSFAAKSNPATSPQGSVRPTDLSAVHAPKHALASMSPSKPQPSALASFAKLEPTTPSTPLKQQTPPSALSSFASREASSTAPKSPNHIAPVTPSALSSSAASEGLAPLKRPSALASFAAHEAAPPTNSLKSPIGTSGSRPLASLGLNVHTSPDEKYGSREVEAEDDEKTSTPPTSAEAKDGESASKTSGKRRRRRRDEPVEEKATGRAKEDSSSDENDSAAAVSDSDDAKDCKPTCKESPRDDEKDSKCTSSSKKTDHDTLLVCPPPLSFPIKRVGGDPVLLAIVTEDVVELQRLLQASCLGSLGAIRDDLSRSVMHYAVGLGAEAICRLVLGYPQACGCVPAASPLKDRGKSTSPTTRRRPSPTNRNHSSKTSAPSSSHPSGDAAAGLAVLLFGLLEPVDSRRRSILHYVCHSKNPNVWQLVQDQPCVLRCLRKHLAHFDVQDDYGMYPLSYAALHGHRQAVSWCFQLGCGINYEEADVAAIVQAASDNSIRRVLLDGFELVDRQRHASPKAWDHRKAVSVQSRMKHLAHADINTPSGSLLQSSLHKIAQFGQVESLDYALDRNVDVNAVDANGWTALHYCAADVQHQDATAAIASTLLMCDVIEVDVPSMQGRTPLHVAASSGRDDVLQLLLRHGADANALDEHGMSPLHVAAHAGHVSVADSLLWNTEHGHSTSSTDALQTSPRRRRHSRTPTNQNPLHIASSAGHESMVRRLCAWDVEDGRWSAEKDCHGRTPVQCAKTKATRDAFTNVWQAASDGSPEKLQACLQRCISSDLTPTPRSRKTLLHLAVMGFAREVTAKAKQPGHAGAAPAKAEVRYGHTIRLARQALDDAQQSALAGDDLGVTPLMLAAACGNVFLADELTRAGRKGGLEATDTRGNTALHYAYAYGHSRMARWIETHDANLAGLENDDGRTPLDVAGYLHKILPNNQHGHARQHGVDDETKDDGGSDRQDDD